MTFAEGFAEANVIFTNEYIYNYCWFKIDLNCSKNIPFADEFIEFDNGVNAKTYGWLFPGEGLSISWSPKILVESNCTATNSV